MKKALALVLALVLALSMAVSAFAAVELVDLVKVPEAKEKEIKIPVIDVEDPAMYYVYEGGKYYIALEDAEWEDIKLTVAGDCLTAKLVEYDPAKMNVYGMEIVFEITKKGEPTGEEFVADGVEQSTDVYEEACEAAEAYNDAEYVTYYDVAVKTNVNIIELVVADNYTVHYQEASLKIEATLDDEDYVGTVKFINDVYNFEYEDVKWTAKNFEEKWEDALDEEAYLLVDWLGYSDYHAWLIGYDVDDAEYDEWANRYGEFAAVISTTAFRAIEGKNIRVIANDNELYDLALAVTLFDIAKGQKGVNFQAYTDLDFEDTNLNGVRDRNEDVNAIEFGFYGDQKINGKYEVLLKTGYDWFELRELFGVEVEEDDIVEYYVVDGNGKVVATEVKDYMTDDLTEDAEFVLELENGKLGEYKIVLEAPANEVAGEENPNTGAEAVVGVVAALAVVSVATAAAVSLKK